MAASSLLPTAISFSGCGFIGVYHIGVIKCLQQHGYNLLKSINKFGGASAGSLAAAVLATCPEKVSCCKALVYELASQVRNQRFGAFSYGFRLSDHVEKFVDKVLPENAHELANGRLYLSITTNKTKVNKVISTFASREELVQCLVSSCHIPYYSGRELITYQGELVYDGGFTNNLLSFDNEETIQVTPFCGGTSYICPRDTKGRWNLSRVNQDFRVNFANLVRAKDAIVPQPPDKLEKYYEQGYLDALNYLLNLAETKPEAFTLGPEDVSEQLKEKIKNEKTPVEKEMKELKVNKNKSKPKTTGCTAKLNSKPAAKPNQD